MQLPYRFALALLSLVAYPACGHTPTPTAPTSSSAETEGSGFGPENAPLPDGRYGLHPVDESSRIQTLEVSQGRLALTSPNPVPLNYMGKGPLWQLASTAAGNPKFAADLLVVDSSHGWIRPVGKDRAIEFARIQEVPEGLRGTWGVVPEIGKLTNQVSSLQLSASSGTFTALRREQKLQFSTAWLQSRGDRLPTMLVELKAKATLLIMVVQKGLLALSVPDEGLTLFTNDFASADSGLTIDGLRTLKPIYFTGRQAYDLKCGPRGCDLVELDVPPSPIHLRPVEKKPGIALRLRAENSPEDDLVLVPMNQRLLAAGTNPDALALVPLAPTAIPAGLIGSWKTSSVFSPNEFDLAEIHLGHDGVATTRTGKRRTPAYLVQTAFDDGILLLEHGPGNKQWNLWRFTKGRDRWYLSPWKAGAGPLALWQGTEPAWIAARGDQTVPSDGEPSNWKNLDSASKKAATNALNVMYAGAVVFYESTTSNGSNAHKQFRFPGKSSYRFTPDACKKNGTGPSAATWQGEPWQSLNFVPPEKADWMGYDFISDGEGRNAHFVAIVAIDTDCSSKPVYTWRRGRINDTGDVEGAYVPKLGNEPPELNAPETDK